MIQARIALERIVRVHRRAYLTTAYGNRQGLKNYIRVVEAELENINLSDDPYLVLAGSMQLVISATDFASNPPHNDLDKAERVHAELTIATVTAVYSYCAKTIRKGNLV